MNIEEIIENGFEEIKEGINFIISIINGILNSIAEEIPIIYYGVIVIIITLIIIKVIKVVLK